MELVLGGAFYHHRDKHSISSSLKGGGPAFKNSCSNANVNLYLIFSTDNFIRSSYPTSYGTYHPVATSLLKVPLKGRYFHQMQMLYSTLARIIVIPR
ncbi:hypothetical protein T03_1578 [Trichinella britovi]|uniref:Uncharacterized protein n=1 Tax=Trichinella britovi TaxID=45882 RepID=A0A0V1CX38_TRIBR|nr:hypothetical protein T03_1578 [Trichinella britovi]